MQLIPAGKSISDLFRVGVASGRGEAAWPCVAMCFSTLVARLATSPAPVRLRLGFCSGFFADICEGFKDCADILLLCAKFFYDLEHGPMLHARVLCWHRPQGFIRDINHQEMPGRPRTLRAGALGVVGCARDCAEWTADGPRSWILWFS